MEFRDEGPGSEFRIQGLSFTHPHEFFGRILSSIFSALAWLRFIQHKNSFQNSAPSPKSKKKATTPAWERRKAHIIPLRLWQNHFASPPVSSLSRWTLGELGGSGGLSE